MGRGASCHVAMEGQGAGPRTVSVSGKCDLKFN